MQSLHPPPWTGSVLPKPIIADSSHAFSIFSIIFGRLTRTYYLSNSCALPRKTAQHLFMIIGWCDIPHRIAQFLRQQVDELSPAPTLSFLKLPERFAHATPAFTDRMPLHLQRGPDKRVRAL